MKMNFKGLVSLHTLPKTTPLLPLLDSKKFQKRITLLWQFVVSLSYQYLRKIQTTGKSYPVYEFIFTHK